MENYIKQENNIELSERIFVFDGIDTGDKIANIKIETNDEELEYKFPIE